VDGSRRTRIVATLGPATEDLSTLRALLAAGVDVVRLNFSHGNLEEKARTIGLVRKVEGELGRRVAILQDLQGPKTRVGPIPAGPITLRPEQTIEIYEDGREGSSSGFSITARGLHNQMQPGDSIFIDDGNIELAVSSVSPGLLRCKVVVGGQVSTGKGVNVPGARLTEGALTEKDRDDLRFGLRHGVDYVALSFVRGPRDAQEARAIMDEEGISVPLLAKIEKNEAVDRMTSVLRAFAGAMVARGDLGVELGPEKVPGVQKRLIKECVRLGKPVITATQMLESMTFNRRPTRAEASDVANAVLDGTSAVMLSGETAVGAHPVEVVKAMHRIVVEAERLLQTPPHLPIAGGSTTRAVCSAAVHLAEATEAAALVAFTRSGRTAQVLSSLQPRTPIIALCRAGSIARRLTLWRGVFPLSIDGWNTADDPTERILLELRSRSLLKKGSRVVALGAAPGTRTGQTNFVRILTV
jgi:pyruvate kinase